MLFPSVERVVYAKNPLVEVICQIRYPTILRIGAGHAADFQERIRNEYPVYSIRQPTVELPQMPKELSTIVEQMIPRPTGIETHRFSSKDEQRFISLSQDFLALTECKYVRWESFRGEFVKAEEALKAVYKPAFLTRVGLRYKDLISRRKLGLANTKWSDLLQPHIVGELGVSSLSDSITFILTQSVVRVPEIPGAQVRLNHGTVRLPDTSEECYVIDADFFVESKEGINEPFVVLDKLNQLAGRLFRWAITDMLHKVMEPSPL
jgi:uncharacterized protein (TIGR04255 family)